MDMPGYQLKRALRGLPCQLIVLTMIMGLVATGVQGETRVLVPSTMANTEGEFAAGVIQSDYHSQQVYSASEFSQLTASENTLIRVDWRPDGNLVGPETYSAERWIMKFSTTPKNPGELDSTYANNVGSDEVVVYDGPGSMTTNNTGPAGGPKDIDYGIDFQVPFVYDPSKGNLLWDLTIIGGSSPLSIDWTLQGEGLTSTLYGGAPEDTIAPNNQTSGGHIALFTFVPEPSSCLLMLTAVVGVLMHSRKDLN
jgi:hypothetical protein